jgi:hypothetical protein
MALAGRIATIALLLLILTRLEASDSLNGGGVTPKLDLKGQLEKGLFARRPVEFAYIAQVVAYVEAGVLPRSLVDTSFGWARQKSTRRLQYFQFALRARAEKAHLNLPGITDLRAQGIGL